ncbi:hypothetical protein L218DRAFT_1015001 [Marasmius fiardii PR-910]|nr:hypothetical protein L218DRAFT_1015001 [Marasmius fiardii PR-910]
MDDSVLRDELEEYVNEAEVFEWFSTFVNRIWFDMKTTIRYMKVYQSLMNGEGDLLESFNTRLEIVEMFRLARVPIYHIRPVLFYKAGFLMTPLPLPNVFVGPPDDPMNFLVMLHFGACFFATSYTPNTFKTTVESIQADAILASRKTHRFFHLLALRAVNLQVSLNGRPGGEHPDIIQNIEDKGVNQHLRPDLTSLLFSSIYRKGMAQ